MSNVKNYTEQGGEVTHIGGKLVFEEGASVEGFPSLDIPVATADTPGVVKPGEGLSVGADGTLNAVGGSGGNGGNSGASGSGTGGVIVLDFGGVNLADAFRAAVDVTASVSVNQFLRATDGGAPVVLTNVYWNGSLFSCQAVSCRKREAITSIGAILDSDARLLNVLTSIVYLDEGRVYCRARFLNEDEIPVDGVTLDQDTLTMQIGDENDITATVSPSDAYDDSVFWESSDTGVVGIISGEHDHTVRIAAVGDGTASVTVTTNNGSYTASCEVTVMPSEPDPEPEPEPDPEPEPEPGE